MSQSEMDAGGSFGSLEEDYQDGLTKKSLPNATGAGLSTEELEELHKTDPKRVKRILANRSSAARSKVRKLRYIAELDSKSAALQQQMTEMTAELRNLQENTARIGSENEWLLTQLLVLQEQTLRLDQETQSLRGHIPHSLATSQTLPQSAPRMGGTELNPNFDSFMHSRQPLQSHQPVRIPESAFMVLQEQSLPSLQIPRHQILPTNLPPHPSFAAVTSQFRSPGEGQNLLFPDALHSFSNDHPGATLTSLNSYNGSDGSGSGLSSTTQELQLQPENPALLTLLRSFELGPRRAPGPKLPFTAGLNQYERSSSLGMMPSREHRRSFGGSPVRAIDPGRMISLPQMAQMGMLESRRNSSIPPDGGYEQPPPSTQPPLPAGLARWPRHASDPQGFQLPPRPRPQ